MGAHLAPKTLCRDFRPAASVTERVTFRPLVLPLAGARSEGGP
jgi:hypothetical protein